MRFINTLLLFLSFIAVEDFGIAEYSVVTGLTVLLKHFGSWGCELKLEPVLSDSIALMSIRFGYATHQLVYLIFLQRFIEFIVPLVNIGYTYYQAKHYTYKLSDKTPTVITPMYCD
jgi:hypothetical protein